MKGMDFLFRLMRRKYKTPTCCAGNAARQLIRMNKGEFGVCAAHSVALAGNQQPPARIGTEGGDEIT